jgi:alkylmercury lyase
MTTIKPTREELNWTREAYASSPALTDDDRRIGRALTRLMVQDGPVEARRLAGTLGRTEAEVEAALEGLPLIYRDEEGRVAGLMGLSAIETPHRLLLDDRSAYGWCAQDALFLSIVLDILFDRQVRIESTCPSTGTTVRLEASPSGITKVEPEGTVMSFLRVTDPGAVVSGDARTAITDFCHYVHFFASREAAVAWTAEHKGTFPVEIEEIWPFAQEIALRQWIL